MEKVLIGLPGNETITRLISVNSQMPVARSEIRRFPDGESYVRFLEDVKNKTIFLVCTLHRPDEQLLPLYFAAAGARKAGASKIVLLAPYLAYLRQDKVFNEGEVVSSALFASLLSSFVDKIVTVDPHLHRLKSLSEIYTIPTRVVHSTDHIAKWIAKNVARPLLIGPDSESRQWVSKLASRLNAPFLILQKTRRGDRLVEVEVPEVANYRNHVPVLLDDIVSTGKTMVETVKHLLSAGLPAPVCIAVHAVFAPGAYEELMSAGASRIVSCNTIVHASNEIDVTDLLVDSD